MIHKPLLTLLFDEALPEDQVLIDLLHGLLKVPAELHLLPESGREGGPLHGLHVQVAHALLLPHGGVLGVGQGARAPGVEVQLLKCCGL